MTVRILIALACLFFAAGVSGTAAAQEFDRRAYFDVTNKRSLPKSDAPAPLELLKQYIRNRAELDWNKTVVEILLDQPGRRVYRVVLVCKTVEDCGDDSIAGTREAFEIARGKSGWKIVWIGAQIRCWKGRGHQNWAATPCT